MKTPLIKLIILCSAILLTSLVSINSDATQKSPSAPATYQKGGTTVTPPQSKPNSTTVSKPNSTQLKKPTNYINKPLPTLKPKPTPTTKPVVQTKEFKVNGISAWSEAKKNGFKFYPDGATGIKDGSDTWGWSYSGKGTRQRQKGSHIVGGVNMLVYNKLGSIPQMTPTEIRGYFNLFKGKKLKRGWSIKKMTITGNYQWTRKKYRAGSNNLFTQIKIVKPAHNTKASTAMLKEIVLVGPKNGRWQDAFDVM